MHFAAVFLRNNNYITMIAKFVALAALVAVAYGQADRFPAGVNPQLCPNYPHCDNALLAAYNPVPGAAPRYAPPAPAYNPQPSYAPAPYAAAPSHPQPAQYPAGVSPASCPNYPYCSGAPQALSAPPLPGFSARLYPDGVNPSSCPNYPYCN